MGARSDAGGPRRFSRPKTQEQTQNKKTKKQVLVETLANSRVFQRFAVWSHRTSKELTAKTKDHAEALDSTFDRLGEAARRQAKALRQDFEQQLRAQQQQQVQQAGGQQQPGQGGGGGTSPPRPPPPR